MPNFPERQLHFGLKIRIPEVCRWYLVEGLRDWTLSSARGIDTFYVS
jgi:hypothetical protein